MRTAFTHRVSRSAVGCLATAMCLFTLASLPVSASSEAEFSRAAAKQKAAEVLCRESFDQVTRLQPTRCLQLRGQVAGLVKTGDRNILMLRLPDEYTVDIELKADRSDVQPNSRVRVLASQSGGYGRTRLRLLDVTWDKTPVDVLLEAARNALKIPAQQKVEARQQVAQQSLPSRGADGMLDYKRWIAYFNPRLGGSEIDSIAGSIVGYAGQYGFTNSDDIYLIIATIAAESRFNPNAPLLQGRSRPRPAHARHGGGPWGGPLRSGSESGRGDPHPPPEPRQVPGEPESVELGACRLQCG